MTHSPADILSRLLITKGAGSDPEAATLGAWPIYCDREPGSPDECITVYNTAGTNTDGRVMQGPNQDPQGIQVRVRSKRPDQGWTKADEILGILESGIYRDQVDIGAAVYLVHCIAKIGDVLSLGKESPTSQRNIHTINAVIRVDQCS